MLTCGLLVAGTLGVYFRLVVDDTVGRNHWRTLQNRVTEGPVQNGLGELVLIIPESHCVKASGLGSKNDCRYCECAEQHKGVG